MSQMIKSVESVFLLFVLVFINWKITKREKNVKKCNLLRILVLLMFTYNSLNTCMLKWQSKIIETI